MKLGPWYLVVSGAFLFYSYLNLMALGGAFFGSKVTFYALPLNASVWAKNLGMLKVFSKFTLSCLLHGSKIDKNNALYRLASRISEVV